ncbi:MAG: PEP-CTERM sorting domain-containing protein [Chthoniobacteraceae bacterium]
MSALPARSFSAAPAFTGVGFLGDGNSSSVQGISGDGLTAVGSSTGASGGTQTFRWTLDGGIQPIDDSAASGYRSSAAAVSFDGSVIVGSRIGPAAGSNFESFRWTAESGKMAPLSDASPLDTMSRAFGVSDDGSVVTGWTLSLTPPVTLEAYRWTAATGLDPVEADQVPEGFSSEGYGISGDGRPIVGTLSSTETTQAFSFTLAGGLVQLPDLQGGNGNSSAIAASQDGDVVVGFGNSAAGIEATRWVSGAVQGLGGLTGALSSKARDVSANGEIVVGFSESSLGTEAFIWDSVVGMQPLKTVLITQYGLTQVADWTLSIATGISADGSVIVGEGINPNGQPEGWVVVVPEPGSAALLVTGAMLLATRRRSKSTRF